MTFSFAHGLLIANSIPFVVLSLLVALNGGSSMLFPVWVIGALGAGLGIWLFGSSAQVVGASGVVFALNGFLLARSYYSPNLLNIAIASLTLFLYSGVSLSLLDVTATGISWVGHLSGFVAGIFTAPLLTAKAEKG